MAQVDSHSETEQERVSRLLRPYFSPKKIMKTIFPSIVETFPISELGKRDDYYFCKRNQGLILDKLRGEYVVINKFFPELFGFSDEDEESYDTEEEARMRRIYKSNKISTFNSLPPILGSIPATKEDLEKNGKVYWDEEEKNFFLYDESSNEYVMVSYLPCTYCGTGLSGVRRKRIFGGLYCGCQDYKDDYDDNDDY
jgi:hypothetical protein